MILVEMDSMVFNLIPVMNRYGQLNSAFAFNGQNSHISIPYAPLLGSTSGTVSAWIKVNGLFNGNQQLLFGQNGGRPQLYANSSYRCNGVARTAGFSWRANGTTGTNDFATVCGTSQLDDNIWHHLVGVYDAVSLKIYVDGVLESTTQTNLLQVSNQNEFYIGGFGPLVGSYQFFNGTIDDVVFWNRKLSDFEIFQLSADLTESYLWSTGATTPSINVSPTQTTTYYVTVSNGISSCVDSVTVTVLPNTTWYADGDGDGYGSAMDTVSSCTGAPSGYVGNNTDCNDLSATAYPGEPSCVTVSTTIATTWWMKAWLPSSDP